MIKSCKDLLTKTLNPETLVREVAIATVERESWLRWPTITNDTTCKRYCNTLATTIGAAIVPTFFSSSLIALLLFIHPHFPVSEPSSITASISFLRSICSLFVTHFQVLYITFSSHVRQRCVIIFSHPRNYELCLKN